MKSVTLLRIFFSRRRLIYFASLIIVIGIAFFYFLSYAKNSRIAQSRIVKSRLALNWPALNRSAPVILLWTTFFGRVDFYFGLGRQPFLNYKCPANDCIVTTNRSQLPQSDAVLFHPRNFNFSDLPDLRSTDQYFVFIFLEPPVNNFAINFASMYGFFNWTMTYRWDSDVVAAYGKVRPVAQNVSVTRHRKLVAWIVSNCHSNSGREAYVQRLSKYIAIDKFGKCWNRECNPECEKSVFENYKFYLSFENSLCKDYVTEKLFKVLPHDVVPIVYGAANYSAVAPPHSYIDARKFNSPQLLARYLHQLDRNDTAYNEYLKWKSLYQVDTVKMAYNFCELCKKLHENREEKVYKDIDRWWHNGNENSNLLICERPSIV